MLKNKSLNVNEAALHVTTNYTDLSLWAQAVDCFKCDLKHKANIKNEVTINFNTISKWNFELRGINNTVHCSNTNFNLGELGQYSWDYFGHCQPINNDVPPTDPFRPIYYFESVLLGLVCLRIIFKFAFRFIPQLPIGRLRDWLIPNEIERDLGSTAEVRELIISPAASSEGLRNRRIKSLDVFRGFTICLMIFVNYGGGQYWFFQHSPWNGLTMADIVFPWFAWIMGVGIAIKIKFDKRNSTSTKDLIISCLRRSLMLILLGLIVSNLDNSDLTYYRYFGVLQRLGIAYCFVYLLEIIYMEPQSPPLENLYLICVRDLVESWKQWCFVLVCVVAHTLITFVLFVPGCPRGYVGPGGLGDHAQFFNCTGGAAGYIDRILFGQNHLYSSPTCLQWYDCQLPYDPEGLLGTLTTILCVYLGVHAGRTILVYRKSSERILRWLLACIGCMVLTCMVSFGGINDAIIPINKNLWSLSYVLLSSGLAFLMISVIYIVVDEKQWFSASLLTHVGRHSLVIYVGHGLTDNVFPWGWKVHNSTTHTEYFLMNTCGTLLWILIARFVLSKEMKPKNTVTRTNERLQ